MGEEYTQGILHRWGKPSLPQVRLEWLEGVSDYVEVLEWYPDGGWIRCDEMSDWPAYLEPKVENFEDAHRLAEAFFDGRYREPGTEDSECGECGYRWWSDLEPTHGPRCPREGDHDLEPEEPAEKLLDDRRRRLAFELLDAYVETHGCLPDEQADVTFLVGFDLEAAGDERMTREQWQHRLIDILRPLAGRHRYGIEFDLAWWIAENDRVDGSDRMSATFVPYEPAGGRS